MRAVTCGSSPKWVEYRSNANGLRGRATGAVVLTILALAVPRLGSAQTAPASAPIELRNVVSANPFLLIAAWFNVEYERVVSETSTVGFRVSTVTIGTDGGPTGDEDTKYYNGRVFWRYYPSGAYSGFFFGLDTGLTSLEENSDSHTVLAAGFELGYNWLLGARRKFYVSLGAGADRLFAGDLGDATAVIPTIRIINIGFAF